MSIAAIKTAKGVFEDHIAAHQCKIGQCPERVALWLAYMAAAAAWGREPAA